MTMRAISGRPWCTVVIQRMVFGEKLPSPAVSLSLVILLAGIGTATMTDVQLNPLGSFFGELVLERNDDLQSGGR